NAVDAREGDSAEDPLFSKKLREAVFIPKTILKREDGGVVLNQRRDERLEKMVIGRFERDDDEVGLGHFFCVVCKTEGSRREREIAVAAFDGPAIGADDFKIAPEQEVNIMSVLCQSCAIISADSAGADD